MTDLKALKVGDVVCIMNKGKRVDCAISGARRIQKGKRAGQIEYTLAPMEKMGKAYACRVIGTTYLGLPKGTYTQEQINQATGKMEDTRQEIAEKKAERAERGRAAIGDVDWNRSETWRGALSGTKVGIGDEVVVN